MGFLSNTNRFGKFNQPENNLIKKSYGIENKPNYYYGSVTRNNVRKYDGIMRPQPMDAQDLHKGTDAGNVPRRTDPVQEHYRKLGNYYKNKYGV